MNIVKLEEKLDRAKATAANMRQMAKAGTKLVVHTAIGAATAGAIGAYDEAKGETRENDEGIKTAYVGPVPAALAVAAVGKVGAFLQLGDETGELASSVGQGALDAWSYVEGRRLWIRHEANKAA